MFSAKKIVGMHGWIEYFNCQGLLLGLSLCFTCKSPIALFSTPVANLLHCGWILSTKGNFTISIKGKSSILSCKRCYVLMTAQCYTVPALQAATILVAIASEKKFRDQNSGESRRLATLRLKEKLIWKIINYRTNLINSTSRPHHLSFSFLLLSFRNSTWMRKLTAAK